MEQNTKDIQTKEPEKLQVLYDHYKDTFALTQVYNQSRDHFFYLILLIIAILLFQLYDSTSSQNAAYELLKKAGVDTKIDFTFLSSIAWFTLLGLVVRYYQQVVQLDRWFVYITYHLQGELNTHYDKEVFKREGDAYFKINKEFSWWAKVIYTLIFPIILLGFARARWIFLNQNKSPSVSQNVFDKAICACIAITVLTYLWVKHKKKLREWFWEKSIKKYLRPDQPTIEILRVSIPHNVSNLLKKASEEKGKSVDSIVLDLILESDLAKPTVDTENAI